MKTQRLQRESQLQRRTAAATHDLLIFEGLSPSDVSRSFGFPIFIIALVLFLSVFDSSGVDPALPRRPLSTSLTSGQVRLLVLRLRKLSMGVFRGKNQ